MGACDFSLLRKGDNMNKLFEEAVKEAQYMVGHGGYTGTIAEKHSVVLRKKFPMTEREAEAFIYGGKNGGGDIEQNDKWGPAFAVPICESEENRKFIGYVFYGYASS